MWNDYRFPVRPMRVARHVRPALAAALIALSCSEQPPPVSSALPDVAAVPISGIYQVEGVTVDLQSGEERKIRGTIVLDEKGDSYSASFDLDTMFPTAEGALEAEVIGNGSGRIEGRNLVGTAETQIVVSTVPGVDPGFAFVPRTTTTRIVSSSKTTIAPDGSVEVEIENQPAEGEQYAPTRTRLEGVRVSENAAEAS